jgi:phage tail-like protein
MADPTGTVVNLINVSSFSLKIDQVSWGYFKSVGGISTETDVITANVTNEKGMRSIQKMPGQHKYGELTLARVFNGDDKLYSWRKQVLDGHFKKARRGGSILAHDPTGIPVLKWDFVNAWPSHWKVSDLEAGSDDAMTEELTVTHEGLTMGPP